MLRIGWCIDVVMCGEVSVVHGYPHKNRFSRTWALLSCATRGRHNYHIHTYTHMQHTHIHIYATHTYTHINKHTHARARTNTQGYNSTLFAYGQTGSGICVCWRGGEGCVCLSVCVCVCVRVTLKVCVRVCMYVCVFAFVRVVREVHRMVDSAGKSYSMVGYGVNKGIIPIV